LHPNPSSISFSCKNVSGRVANAQDPDDTAPLAKRSSLLLRDVRIYFGDRMNPGFPIGRQLEQHGVQLASLAQRANAAAIDMALVGLLCFGLEWAMRVSEYPMTMLAIVCGAALAGIFVVELFSGWTLGKFLHGLTIRGSDNRDHGFVRVIIRAVVRWPPVLIFLPSMFVAGDMLALLLWGISLTAVSCYVCPAYLTLVRSGVTPFDMAANSAVAKSR
jgi:hypothetical protein